MSAMLARLKDGYTTGGRGLGMRLMGRFESVPVTPNQLTVAGAFAQRCRRDPDLPRAFRVGIVAFVRARFSTSWTERSRARTAS